MKATSLIDALRRARDKAARAGKPRRKARAKLTDEQRLERDLGRARQWGERYCRNRWRRRPPPRFRWHQALPREEQERRHLQAVAFYQGYDVQTRRRYARSRPWSDSAERAAA